MRVLLVDRVRSVLGFLALTLAVALASPGVRVTQAEELFSYDPALESSAQPTVVAAAPEAGSCAARQAGPLLPLRGMPLRIADGAEAEGMNSMNSRGYNIGRIEPAGELRQLELEVLRHSKGR